MNCKTIKWLLVITFTGLIIINNGIINADDNVHETTEQTTQNKSDDETSQDDNNSVDAQDVKPDYAKVKSNKKVNYYLKVKNTSKKYNVYASGGYNTSENNIDAISNLNMYRGKEVLVIQEQKLNNGTYLKIKYRNRLVGFVNRNSMNTSYKRLNVKVIGQRPKLPTGCEIVATAMMLDYGGAKQINKYKLANEMPRSYNGNKGFVGSPYSKYGWWIYPPALLKLVKRHIGSAKNLTGASAAKLRKEIRKNHAVVIWLANVDGFINHAVTMTGYDNKNVYYNDPWTKKRSKMTYKTFKYHRKYDKYRALGY